jgi:YNFM family putative membrane transporter
MTGGLLALALAISAGLYWRTGRVAAAAAVGRAS